MQPGSDGGCALKALEDIDAQIARVSKLAKLFVHRDVRGHHRAVAVVDGVDIAMDHPQRGRQH